MLRTAGEMDGVQQLEAPQDSTVASWNAKTGNLEKKVTVLTLRWVLTQKTADIATERKCQHSARAQRRTQMCTCSFSRRRLETSQADDG